MGGVGVEGSVDDIGESAFEDSHGFFLGVVVGGSPVQQAACWGVVAGLGESDAVYGSGASLRPFLRLGEALRMPQIWSCALTRHDALHPESL